MLRAIVVVIVNIVPMHKAHRPRFSLLQIGEPFDQRFTAVLGCIQHKIWIDVIPTDPALLQFRRDRKR